MHGSQSQMHYLHFAIMLLLSFIAMFVLMYAMVDRLENVYPNLNQAYMAGLMVAPMAVIEMALMGAMYPNKRWNMAIIVIGILALAFFWFAIRAQTAISDKSFLRSMIPHHAGAILMCDQAPIRDPQVRQLCGRILKSQQAEIAEMKAILQRLD